MNYQIKRSRTDGGAGQRLVLTLTEDRREIAVVEVWRPSWDATLKEGDIQTRVYERSWASEKAGFALKFSDRTEAMVKLLTTVARVQRLLDRMVELNSVDNNEVQRSLVRLLPNHKPYFTRIVWRGEA